MTVWCGMSETHATTSATTGAIGWIWQDEARAETSAGQPDTSLMRNRRGGWLGALARVITTACLLGAATLIGGFFVFITSLNSYDNATPAQADAIVALTGGAHRVADAIETDDQSEIYQLTEDNLRTAAAESDLLEQARANTETFLIGLGTSLGVEVTIVD